MKHLKVRVHGKVQGVYYRATTVERAKVYGVCGFVRNEKDGTVYIEVEGEEENLKQFIEWCHIGSARAVVEKVVIEEGELRHYKSFITIRHD
jgi:acylphosphatase